MTGRSAQRLRTLAVRLRSLPVCAQAYADASLSGGQIEAIVALLDEETVPIFAVHEAELVPYLVPLRVAGLSRAMGAWVSRARPEQAEPTEPERSLHLSRTLEDRWVLDGSLDPETGAVMSGALRLATPEPADASRTPATRRADTLVDVCRFFLDHQQTRAGGRHRPHVNVVVDLEALEARGGGQVLDGPHLDGPTVSRLFCDSAVHRVVMSGRSAILDYGTATRTIPAPLWNALVIRLRQASVWCQGDHIVWVTDGGPTELANLALLCSRHHASSTNPAGGPSSCPIRPSRSPTPRGRSGSRPRPGRSACRGRSRLPSAAARQEASGCEHKGIVEGNNLRESKTAGPARRGAMRSSLTNGSTTTTKGPGRMSEADVEPLDRDAGDHQTAPNAASEGSADHPSATPPVSRLRTWLAIEHAASQSKPSGASGGRTAGRSLRGTSDALNVAAE